MLNLGKIIVRFKERIKILNKLGFYPRILIFPAVFSLMATFFESATVAALILFVKGIVTKDFQFIKEILVFGKIAKVLPYLNNFSNSNVFVFLLVFIFISSIMKNVFYYFSQLLIVYQIRKFTANLKFLIFERYVKFGKMFFDRNSAGYLQNILSNFSHQIGAQLTSINNSISVLFMFILYIIFMFLISWKITIFVLFLLPLFSLIFRSLMNKIKNSSNYYVQSSNLLSKKLFNILSCITLMKLYNNEEKEKFNFANYNKRLQLAEFSIDKKTLLLFPLQEILFLFVTLLLVSSMAYFFVKHKTGDLAAYMVYFYLLRRSQQGFGVINSLKSTFATIKGPVASVYDILNDQDKFIVPQGNVCFEGLKEMIEFKNLNFHYYKDRQILHDVSFLIEKGKITAIVGSTGSGKTTLVSLLLRFYDCPSKSIFIDGVDIRDFTIKSLLNNFSYVSQETLLFNDTLRNVIVYGLENCPSENRIMEVIKSARLFDFVKSLPQGLDTFIGDHGVKLSGGEKQRVAIARAILKDTPILILDEATSSLDSKTEKLIREAIDETIKNKTVIVIAHRLSTIKNADKILVIEQGRFIEEGSLQQLIERNGKFYEYWQEQKFY